MRRASLLLPTFVLLMSCADGRVPLSHALEPGRRLEHRLTLAADITRTLARQSREQRVTAAFRITQEILGPAPAGSPSPQPPVGTSTTPAVAEARVTLVPEALEVDGQPVEVGAVQDFTVQLGEDGRVIAIEETVADPEEVLEPVGLERLLPRLRPVVPGRPVAPGDTWRSETRYEDERGRFSVSASSRLAQLGVTDGHETALVRTTYRSPVRRQETFANAVADLIGEDVGAQEAWFALDGFLVRSSTDSVGTYDVTFRPPAGDPGVAPVQGSLVVRLHTEMQLIGPA